MKRIVLTGATGFLGSHLLRAMVKQGFQVVILKRSSSDTWRINDLLPNIEAYDIDDVALEEAFSKRKVDAVIHTACAYGRLGEPLVELLEANLLFGIRLLEASIQFDAGAFVNTDTFFHKSQNDYSLSKHQFTDWLAIHGKKIKIVNMTLQNVYGHNDAITKFVPWLLEQFGKNVDSIPLSAGSQRRDFIYVDDVVSAYLLTIKNINTFREYTNVNVGTGDLVTVRHFIEQMSSCYRATYPGCNVQLGFGKLPIKDGEISCIAPNIEKLKCLGWKVSGNLKTNIKKLIEESIRNG